MENAYGSTERELGPEAVLFLSAAPAHGDEHLGQLFGVIHLVTLCLLDVESDLQLWECQVRSRSHPLQLY